MTEDKVYDDLPERIEDMNKNQFNEFMDRLQEGAEA